MSEEGKGTLEGETTEPRAEQASPEWLKEVGTLVSDIRAGAADNLKATERIVELQRERHERNRFFESPKSNSFKYMERRDVRRAMRSYEKAMDVIDADGVLAEMQQVNDEVRSLHQYHAALQHHHAAQGRDYGYRGPQQFDRYKEMENLCKKAATDFWDTSNADQGADWMPTVYSSQVVPLERMALNVAASFPVKNIPSGTHLARDPVITARQSVTAVAETVGAASMNQGTVTTADDDFDTINSGYIELEAKYKLRATTGFSRETDEDSAVDTITTHRDAIVIATQEGLESAIINGDWSDFGGTPDMDGANMGSIGAGTANAVFCGLRQFGFYSDTVKTGATARGSAYGDAIGAALDSDNVHNFGRKKMGKFAAVSPTRLRLFVGPNGLLDLINDASDRVQTIDKYGAQATIVTGALAKVWGIPVVVSEWMPENLLATGKADTGTGAKGLAILCRPDRWRLGIKRALEVIMKPDEMADAIFMRTFMRVAMSNAPPTTDKHTWMLYNLSI
jgi:hypothetical protein